MKKLNKEIITLSFMVCFFFNCIAQPSAINRKKNPYSWMFGLSWNVVDDNEEKLPNLFDIKGSWNYPLFPSRISIDKYIRKGWSFEGMAAYNKYTSSKIVNDTIGFSGIFIAGDFHIKYSLNRFMKNAKWFDPYFSSGLGITFRGIQGNSITPTANLAIGTNFWFARKWGFQIQAIGKLALVSNIYVSKMDYFQYTAGIVYRKQPTKKGSTFHKKRYGWTHEKAKYKNRNS